VPQLLLGVLLHVVGILQPPATVNVAKEKGAIPTATAAAAAALATTGGRATSVGHGAGAPAPCADEGAD